MQHCAGGCRKRITFIAGGFSPGRPLIISPMFTCATPAKIPLARSLSPKHSVERLKRENNLILKEKKNGEKDYKK